MYLPSSALDPNTALLLGYRPLTVPYYLPREREILDRAQADMKGVDFKLVGQKNKVEIWRRGMVSLTDSCAVKIPCDPR